MRTTLALIAMLTMAGCQSGLLLQQKETEVRTKTVVVNDLTGEVVGYQVIIQRQSYEVWQEQP